MTETFLLNFDYEVVRRRNHGGGGSPRLRRGSAAVEVITVRKADLPVAYRVRDHRSLGRGRHSIFRHNERLWWPLVESKYSWEIKTAQHLLQGLRAGGSDLFLRLPLNHHFSQRNAYHFSDGHNETLANVHRSAGDLMIVDDELYAAGGAPLLVEMFGTIRIASTRDNRGVPPSTGSLQVRAANDHAGGLDHALCRGRFYVPRSPELSVARRRRSSDFAGITVEALDGGDVIDPLTVRLDAAFRTAWAAMNQSIPRTRPEGFEGLRDSFVKAFGAHGDDRLTAARYFALRDFVRLFAEAKPRPVAVSECFKDVVWTLDLASPHLRHLSPEDARVLLSDEDEEALARLAGIPG